jgi:uncharacterized membrane protein YuzA (DUF378 family)
VIEIFGHGARMTRLTFRIVDLTVVTLIFTALISG